MSSEPLILGAVCYSSKVVDIWEGFKTFFYENGLRFDYVLYSNYEILVEALFKGEVDVAWNSPLAWIRAERMAKSKGLSVKSLAMRDSDCDLTSVIITLKQSGISELKSLANKKVGVGAVDSPQATLIPLEIMKWQGLEEDKNIEVIYHNVLSGKHGDHVGGEEDAVKDLVSGKVDAACLISSNLSSFIKSGIISENDVHVLVETPYFDHCNFTVIEGHRTEEMAKFKDLLIGMSYEDPKIRPLLDMEGLKKWQVGRASQYDILESAVNSFSFYDGDGNILRDDYIY
jgi:phosphonate transport system substrate-binding protein